MTCIQQIIIERLSCTRRVPGARGPPWTGNRDLCSRGAETLINIGGAPTLLSLPLCLLRLRRAFLGPGEAPACLGMRHKGSVCWSLQRRLTGNPVSLIRPNMFVSFLPPHPVFIAGLSCLFWEGERDTLVSDPCLGRGVGETERRDSSEEESLTALLPWGPQGNLTDFRFHERPPPPKVNNNFSSTASLEPTKLVSYFSLTLWSHSHSVFTPWSPKLPPDSS